MISMLVLLVLSVATCACGVEFHVSTSGDDAAPGTAGQPLRNLTAAQAKMRAAIAAGLDGPASVILHAGTWRLSQPMEFGPEDGSDRQTVTWRAAENATVVLTGGVDVPWTVAGDDWRGVLPTGIDEPEVVRIGESLAEPSRYPAGGKFENKAYLAVKKASNHGGKQSPNGPVGKSIQGGWRLEIDGDLSGLPAQTPLRLAVKKIWSMARLRATVDAAAKQVLLDDGLVSGDHMNLLGGAKDFRCWFEAHPSFERRPGQWAYDSATRTVIYRPKPGETPAGSPLVVGALSRLVIIHGTSAKPIQGLRLSGLTFRDAAGPLPSGGLDDLQACRTHRDFSGGMTDPADPGDVRSLPVAVTATFARDLIISGCSFADLGAHGLSISTGCAKVLVQGNTFARIGAVPLLIGTCSQPPACPLVAEVTAERNRISHGGMLHGGAPGIWVGLTVASRISHNHIHDLPYTGISLGWSWTPKTTGAKDNRIEANLIEKVMEFLTDGGGIYCLGDQPGGQITGNLIRDLPKVVLSGHGFDRNGIYLDEGSQGWTVTSNLVIRLPLSGLYLHKPGDQPLNRIEGNSFIPWNGQLGRIFPPYGKGDLLVKAGDFPKRVVFGDNLALTPAMVAPAEEALLKQVGP